MLEAAVNGDKSNGGERAALLTSGRVLMEGAKGCYTFTAPQQSLPLVLFVESPRWGAHH